MDKGGAIFALLTVFAVMLGSWFFAGVHVSMTTEEVEYRVLYELGEGIEIREYGEMTVVSTSSDSNDNAFSVLASYISGNNAEKRKIDMMAPVIIYDNGSSVDMSFILPAMYDADNAPVPVNPAVSIRSAPARKLATISFSGYPEGKILETKRSALDSQLAASDIVTKGDFFLMVYNPPWIPPALMRNEIAIEVE
nr:heme-binding protein [uncultured Methanolobus sp.]